MSEAERIFEQAKRLEGKTVSFTGKDTVGTAAIKKYAIAVDDQNSIYLDEEQARNSKYGGIVAPYTFLFENNHDFRGELMEDGIIAGYTEEFPPPFDLTMRGGNEYEFLQRVRPDDIISFTRVIKSVSLREGKTSPLLILVIEYVYRNQSGEILAVNKETFIYTSRPKREGG